MLERLTRLQLFVLGGVAGVAGAALVAVIIAVFVVEFGWYDVAATRPHGPIAAWILHSTMIHSVRVRSGRIEPEPKFTQVQVKAGFVEYDAHCVMCHGAPGLSRAKWVMGLVPTPPYLIDAPRRWSPAELKFIVGHGIKMTAMPAWGLTQSDKTVWDLVAFLEKLPGITPAQYQKMRRQARAALNPKATHD